MTARTAPPTHSDALHGVRIAFVTRRLPVLRGSGSYVYAFAVLASLQKRGATIEVWFAEGVLPGVRPLLRVDPALLAFASVRIAGAHRQAPLVARWYGSAADVRSSLTKTVLDAVPSLRELADGPAARLVQRLDPRARATREPTRGELRYFRKQRARFDPHVVLVDTVFLASLHADPAFSDVPVRAVLTHDVVYERAANLAAAGIGSELRGWTRDEEARRLRNANAVVAIQPDEARSFAGIVGEPNVVTLPMPVETVVSDAPALPGRMLFVGSNVEQNVIGIRWFLSSVLPRIHRELPDATCEIVGAVASAVEPAPGVVLAGFVPDLQRHYAQASLVVVPLLAGSGLKIKLVEALAHGRAVVTTGVGLQGVIDDGSVPFGARADSSDAFADACVRLLTHDDTRRECEAQAHRWVQTHYAGDVATAAFVERIGTLLGRATAGGVVGGSPIR